MGSILVIKHLFVLAIISIMLNSMFIIHFVASYITIAALYSNIAARSSYFYSNENGKEISTFVIIIESISVIATIACSVLILVGSCLAVATNKKRRKVGLALSVVSILILSIHLVINIIVMALSFMYIIVNTYLLVNGSVLASNVVFQSILLIYNSIFVCVIGCSLRKKNEQQSEVGIPEVSGRDSRMAVISNEPRREPVPAYTHDYETVPVEEAQTRSL